MEHAPFPCFPQFLSKDGTLKNLFTIIKYANVIFHRRHNFTFRLKRRYAPTSIQQKPIMHTVELMTRFLDRMRDISSSSLTPNNLVSVACLSLIFTSEDNHIQLLSVTSINYWFSLPVYQMGIIMVKLNNEFTAKVHNISVSVFRFLLQYSSIENMPSSQSLYGNEKFILIY